MDVICKKDTVELGKLVKKYQEAAIAFADIGTKVAQEIGKIGEKHKDSTIKSEFKEISEEYGNIELERRKWTSSMDSFGGLAKEYDSDLKSLSDISKELKETNKNYDAHLKKTSWIFDATFRFTRIKYRN